MEVMTPTRAVLNLTAWIGLATACYWFGHWDGQAFELGKTVRYVSTCVGEKNGR